MRTAEMIRTMLDMYDKGGLLPIWELGGNETYTMIGNHAISVVTDAYLKGIRGFDTEMALQAMIHSATRDHYGLDAYIKYGHIPGEKEHESISKTLEYAYNDWNIAMMANAMGRDDVYREYIRRAQFYKNIFDPSTGFMRPRNILSRIRHSLRSNVEVVQTTVHLIDVVPSDDNVVGAPRCH